MRVLFVNFNDGLSQNTDFLARLEAYKTATNLACLANMVANEHHLVKFFDYDVENLPNDTLSKDCDDFVPHVVVANVKNNSIIDNLAELQAIKDRRMSTKIIVVSNYLFHLSTENLSNYNLDCVSVILREEPDDGFLKVVDAMVDAYTIKRISNVRYKNTEKKWEHTDSVYFNHLDLTSVVYRKGLKNELYKWVDNATPMAIIKATRGSSSDCLCETTQALEGPKIRARTPESIAREIENCYITYGITNFYLESDDFNWDNDWAYDVASAICDTSVIGKINIMTRLHMKELHELVVERLQLAGMKIALLNLYSGAEETLKRAKVGCSSLAHYERGMKILHHYVVKTYAVYRIGFPWETKKHIAATTKQISTYKHTYVDFKILAPAYNEAIVDNFKNENLLGEYKDFHWVITGTQYMKLKNVEAEYKKFMFIQKIFGKFSKEPISEDLYKLSDADKKILKRK